jgi:hypothetical protein
MLCTVPGGHENSPEHRFYMIQGFTQGLLFSPRGKTTTASEHREGMRREGPLVTRERHGGSLEGEHDAGIGS